jgi:hypothetical protein
MKPYKEKKVDDKYHRLFNENVQHDDLVWHKDREDRIIKSTQNTDWLIQLDNELPKSINEEVFIPKEVWHRLIKGTGDLNIIVQKLIS